MEILVRKGEKQFCFTALITQEEIAPVKGMVSERFTHQKSERYSAMLENLKMAHTQHAQWYNSDLEHKGLRRSSALPPLQPSSDWCFSETSKP